MPTVTDFGIKTIDYSHDGTGGAGGTFDPQITYSGTSHIPNWRPYGDGDLTNETDAAAASITLTGGAGTGNARVVAWAVTGISFLDDGLTGTVPEISGFPALDTLARAFEANTGLTTFSATPIGTGCVVSFIDRLFADCSGLTGVLDFAGLPAVTTASSLALNCVGITGISNLNTMTLCTTLQSAFDICNSLTGDADFTGMTALQNMSRTFRFATLTSITGINTCTALTTLSSCFNGNNIAGVIDLTGLVNLTGMDSTFRSNTGITGLVGLNTCTSLTDLSLTFLSCTGLTGNVNFTGLTSVMYGNQAFSGCNLTSITGFNNMTALGNASRMFENNANLAGNIDFAGMSITDLSYFCNGCGSLNTISNLNTCTGITTMFLSFRNCSSLSGSVSLDGMTVLTTASTAFNNTNLTGFVIGTAATLCTNWESTVKQSSVPAADIDQMLIDIDNNGPNAGTLNYDTLTGNAHFDSARSAAAAFTTGALESLINTKSWVRLGVYA